MRKTVLIAVLVAVIAAPPAIAAGGKGQRGERDVPEATGKVRFSSHDDAVIFDYVHRATRERMQGYVDRTGAVSIHGLTVKMLGRDLKDGGEGRQVVMSWAGKEIVLPDKAAVEADPSVLAPVQALVSSWTQAIDISALEGFRATMFDLAVAQKEDTLVKQASCAVELFFLALDTAAVYLACGSGVLPACVLGYILFIDQLYETAHACNWCGFGRPC